MAMMTHHLWVRWAGYFFSYSRGGRTWFPLCFSWLIAQYLFLGFLFIICVLALIVFSVDLYWWLYQINSLPTVLSPYTLLILSIVLITISNYLFIWLLFFSYLLHLIISSTGSETLSVFFTYINILYLSLS